MAWALWTSCQGKGTTLSASSLLFWGAVRTVAAVSPLWKLAAFSYLGKETAGGFWGRNLEGWAGPLSHWPVGTLGQWAKLRSPRKTNPYLTVRRGSAQDLGTEEDGPWVLELWARMTFVWWQHLGERPPGSFAWGPLRRWQLAAVRGSVCSEHSTRPGA